LKDSSGLVLQGDEIYSTNVAQPDQQRTIRMSHANRSATPAANCQRGLDLKFADN
jgi:hypothetical protein